MTIRWPNPQFFTSLFTVSRSYFAPIKSTGSRETLPASTPNSGRLQRRFILDNLPIFIFTFTHSLSRMRDKQRQRHFPDSCTYGGGGGYRTPVLPDFQSVSTNCNYIYTTLNTFCQPLFCHYFYLSCRYFHRLYMYRLFYTP